jgi:hypothetical protein
MGGESVKKTLGVVFLLLLVSSLFAVPISAACGEGSVPCPTGSVTTTTTKP